MITRAEKAKLPKAPLLMFERWGKDQRYGGRRRRFVAYHRVANAAFVRIGRLAVHWRMPWLEHAARVHLDMFHAGQ